MDAKPLKKELYERVVALGGDIVTLEFSGGSDEGYLYVEIRGDNMAQYGEQTDEVRKKIRDLESDIEEWVWTVYQYSGAGDGASFIGFYTGAQSLTIQVDTYVISW